MMKAFRRRRGDRNALPLPARLRESRCANFVISNLKQNVMTPPMIGPAANIGRSVSRWVNFSGFELPTTQNTIKAPKNPIVVVSL